MLLAGDYVPHECPVVLEMPEELLLCNLEAPVLGNHFFKPASKAGPNLRTHSLTDGFPKKIFSLANNHIMDFGENGLVETLAVLRKNNVLSVGAGRHREEAQTPVFFEEDGVRIAVLGCCERQFGMAEKNKPGVCEMGLWMIPAIVGLKKNVDVVIVSCHAALEFSPWPSPRLRQFYHALIDAGADIIHGHHAHVPQGYEVYKHGVIFYSLGNFVVDKDPSRVNPHFLWSLTLRCSFSTGCLKWEPVFCEIEKNDGVIRVKISNQEQSGNHHEYISLCNRGLSRDETCEAYWQEAAMRFYYQLYHTPLGLPPVCTRRLPFKQRMRTGTDALIRLAYSAVGREFKTSLSRKHALASYNFFNCPSHADAIATALGMLLGERTDLRNTQTKEDADALLVGCA